MVMIGKVDTALRDLQVADDVWFADGIRVVEQDVKILEATQ